MARIACDLGDILLAARLALVTANVVTDAQAYLSLDPDTLPDSVPEPPLAAVSFTTFDQRPDTVNSEIGNDDTPYMEGELAVTIWTRLQTDEPGQDTLALTDNTYGMTVLAKKTLACLNNVDLMSGTDEITLRTLTFLGVRNRGKWKKDPNWRRIDVRFNCAFNWQVT